MSVLVQSIQTWVVAVQWWFTGVVDFRIFKLRPHICKCWKQTEFESFGGSTEHPDYALRDGTEAVVYTHQQLPTKRKVQIKDSEVTIEINTYKA